MSNSAINCVKGPILYTFYPLTHWQHTYCSDQRFDGSSMCFDGDKNGNCPLVQPPISPKNFALVQPPNRVRVGVSIRIRIRGDWANV